MIPGHIIRPMLRPLIGAFAGVMLTQSTIAASAADSVTPSPIRPVAVALQVWRLEPDIYLDRGGRLAVLTQQCQEPALFDTDVVLRPRADSNEPELAFPSGLACPVSFVGNDNAYFTSATEGGYIDVYTGQTVSTADCPDLSSVEPALVRYDLVILMGDRPAVCHLAHASSS